MGKKRSASEQLPAFFKRFFSEDVGGKVELRVFPNDRGPMEAREWVSDAVSFVDFVGAFDEKDSNLAIYFGPAVRRRSGGTKADLAFTRAVWAEVDCDKLGWETDDVARKLHSLPGILQPSLCINSGHGLHLYWYLNEDAPLETPGEIAVVEGVNKLLRDMVSGDNVWDATRVMRVPGTWNTKARPVQSRIIWHYHWHEHSLRAIHDAVAEFDKVLEKDGFVPRQEWERRDAERRESALDPDTAYQVGSEDKRKTKSARGLNIWNNCRYGGGPGYVGLDEAIMLFTAHEYCRLTMPTQAKLDQIVDDTIWQVKRVWEREASAEQWDWKTETDEVRNKLMRWVRRWDEIKGRENGSRKGKQEKRPSKV